MGMQISIGTSLASRSSVGAWVADGHEGEDELLCDADHRLGGIVLR